jgi:hypothetical protein
VSWFGLTREADFTHASMGRLVRVGLRRYRVAIPGWPVRVYISGTGRAYRASAVCRLLIAGQEKARERGQVVRPLRCVALVEVRDRRRPCAGCIGQP